MNDFTTRNSRVKIKEKLELLLNCLVSAKLSLTLIVFEEGNRKLYLKFVTLK